MRLVVRQARNDASAEISLPHARGGLKLRGQPATRRVAERIKNSSKANAGWERKSARLKSSLFRGGVGCCSGVLDFMECIHDDRGDDE